MKYIDLDKERIIQEFSILSEELSLLYPGETFYMYIVGGVPLMEYTNYKKSSDIDVFAISDNRLMPLLDSHFMNMRASGMSVSFSSNIESRFKISDVFSSDNLKVFSACLEDIVASKLIVNRDKDFEDITNKDIIDNVDFELLDNIIKNELSIDITNELNYKQLLRTYDKWLNYVEEYFESKKGVTYGR